MSLEGKRILITAGPTWIPIDDVRVITNIATGQTGLLIASQARRHGARVTLILGPTTNAKIPKLIKVIRFRFFDELRSVIQKELRNYKYDVIIHSAAVSDFRPAKQFKNKIHSDRVLNLKLIPLPKIIRDIRLLAPKALLIMFKLESGVADRILLRRAKAAQSRIGSNLVVANRLKPYRALIIGKGERVIQAMGKSELARKLLRIIDQVLGSKYQVYKN